MADKQLEIGQRVRVVQQVPRLSGSHATAVEGEVVSFGFSKTGSWFAHSKDKKLWVERVELKKADGELVMLNLDQYSRVELLGDTGDDESDAA
ncbi:MAG: hypothetical protein AAFR76_07590 [Planctomycetota bacterium]